MNSIQVFNSFFHLLQSFCQCQSQGESNAYTFIPLNTSCMYFSPSLGHQTALGTQKGQK